MAVAGLVVAVTGGGRGIGRAIAEAFSAGGARVAVGDLDPVGGARALDVRDESSFQSFLDGVERELGPLDVLVNNAGVAVPGTLLATSAAQHQLQVDVNVGGVLRGLRLALPGMVARGRGHVVSIASAGGRIPAPNAAVYSATKHAVVGLTEAMRGELRGTGVRVTAILPTVVRTEMSAGLRLRGLPAVGPEAVARSVVRVVAGRRRRATVYVPWWLGGLAIVDRISPQWLSDLARRLAVVEPPTDSPVRAEYDQRVARQIDPPSTRRPPVP